MAWNTAKIKEFANKMREHDDKYGYPTKPKKKKPKKAQKDR